MVWHLSPPQQLLPAVAAEGLRQQHNATLCYMSGRELSQEAPTTVGAFHANTKHCEANHSRTAAAAAAASRLTMPAVAAVVEDFWAGCWAGTLEAVRLPVSLDVVVSPP